MRDLAQPEEAEGDYDDEGDALHHLYVQWLADAQVKELADRASQRGPGLYLDLPLGVNPDGYDVWRDREAFALNVIGQGAARLRSSRSARTGASRAHCTPSGSASPAIATCGMS